MRAPSIAGRVTSNEQEMDLRRQIERVAAQRRALPPGGKIPEAVATAQTATVAGLKQNGLSVKE